MYRKKEKAGILWFSYNTFIVVPLEEARLNTEEKDEESRRYLFYIHRNYSHLPASEVFNPDCQLELLPPHCYQDHSASSVVLPRESLLTWGAA